MDYELYHDESKEYGYWHGMLLVPVDTKNRLITYLETARKNYKYYQPISLKNIRKESGQKFGLVRTWLSIALQSMMQELKQKEYISLGRQHFEDFDELIKLKFILARERDAHQKMVSYPDHTSKIETTFRMFLKGGLHFLFDVEEPVNIVKIHLDGFKHHKRHFNKQRAIDRIFDLRNYCSFNNDENLIDDRTSNHLKENSQAYEDCQLLQLTDLLVSGFRVILGYGNNQKQKKAARPLKMIVDSYHQGIARMRNSRWNNSFCMSECYLENNKWHFKTIEYQQIENKNQLSLFDIMK